MMRIRNLLLLLFLTYGVGLIAQDISIQGTITLATDNSPLPEHSVVALTPDGVLSQAVTDEDGFYQFSLPMTTSGNETIAIETVDICNGDVLTNVISLSPNQISYDVDFIVCSGIDPPDPTDTCAAFFFAEQLTVDDGLLVHFFNISTASDPIISWNWNFGDGEESDEESPVHSYTEPGTYVINLTIQTTTGCTASFTQLIEVVDEGNCDCPEDNYDPVCVITPSGAFFTFTNSCYAECAGYGPDEYFECDGGCDCYTLYDPVCVDTGSGTITFSNSCFAECEGFGPDDWYHCNDCGCPDGNGSVCVSTPAGEITFPNVCIAESFGYTNSDIVDCDPGCICPTVYDPVCVATPSGGILTFGNACEAECEGFGPDVYYSCDGNNCVCDDIYNPVCYFDAQTTIMWDNPCSAVCSGFDDPSQWSVCQGSCVCDDVYDPVCVSVDGTIITFVNACRAECFGFNAEDFVTCDDDCVCPGVWDPVCVNGIAGQITFGNACLAICAGFTDDQIVDCDNDCVCPDIYDPVCIQTATGIQTFGNMCLAECAGYNNTDVIDCDDDCICPDVWAPVCVTNADGTTQTFGNACEAHCEGYTDDQFVSCNDDCNCTDEWDPVCVNGFAGQITFGNYCLAICAGFGDDQIVTCDDDCICPAVWDPVCVQTPNGTITFGNACEAECAGYTPGDFVNCNAPFCNATIIASPTDDYTIAFGSIASGTPQSYSWDFGDGETSDEATPVHTYPNTPASYFVQLTVVDQNGCAVTASQWLYVGPDCYSIIIAIPQEDDPLTIAFGAIATGNVTSWFWDFGDGVTSDEGSPVHSYESAGTYTVTLVISNNNCTSTTVLELVVGDGDCNCPAVYDPVCVSGIAGPIEFGNACEAECAGFGPEDFIDCNNNCNCPEYLLPVCVTDANGDELIFDNPCFAVCAGYTNPFEWRNCNNPSCPCPDVWAPVCVITAAGVIQFGNECEAGCFGFDADDFAPCITDCLCTDEYDPVCVIDANGNELVFDNACLATCEGYDEGDWYACNPNCGCDADYDPVCVLTNSGIILFSNACLAQCAGYGPNDFVDCDPADCDNCSDEYNPVCVQTDCGPISFPNACIATCHGFGPNTYQPCEPPVNLCQADFDTEIVDANTLNVIFHDASVSTDPIIKWIWNFGDGSTGEGPLVEHEYSEPGVYYVTLTIVTEHCESTTSQHICIGGGGGGTGPDCQAMFFFDQENVLSLLTFNFNDMSLGNVTSWAWEFGDGDTSDEQNPIHTYDEPGLYFVTLTVSNDDDCTSSATMVLLTDDDVIYGEDCRALFLPIINPDAPEVFFLNLSSDDAITYTWDFGDGTTAEGPFAFHAYDGAGIYTVTLTITTEDGCTDTFTATVDLVDNLFTGTPTYSLVNDVPELEWVESITLMPNPTTGETWLNFSAETASTYGLRILNPAGKLISEQEARAQAGENRIRLDMNDYPAGLYFVQIRTERGQHSLRLVKH